MAATEELKVKVSADVAGAVNGMKQVNNELAKTATQTKKTGKDFTGLSRVIQDLPFGFTAISNNLTQLLPAAGAAGLAFSGLVAALTFAQTGLANWTRGLGGSAAATKEAAEAAEQYKKAVSGAFAEVAKEAATVEVLVATLQRENLSRQQRAEAIEQLQRIAPAYFGTLSAEKFSIEALTKSYDRYNASLHRAAEGKVLEKQLEDVIAKRLELSKIIGADGDIRDQYAKEEIINGQKVRTMVLSTYETERAKTANKNEYLKLLDQERNIVGRLAQLKPPDLIQPPEKVKETTKVFKKEVQKALGEIRTFIESEPIGEAFFRIKLAEVRAANNPIESVGEKLTKELLPKTIPLRVNVAPDIQIPQPDLLRDSLEKALNDTISKVSVEGFSVIGDGIAAAITGGDLNGVFSNLFNFIGGALQDLGKQMIALAPIITLLKAAIKTLNPALMLPAGVALVAIGGALRNLKPKGFATGGVIPPGFPNDSYYARLTSGERVLTPSQNKEWEGRNLGRAATMAFPDYLPVFRMSANEWSLMYERFSKSAGRTN
jgi:hypothetical protein